MLLPVFLLTFVFMTNVYANESLDLILSSCRKNLDFDSITEFEKFIKVFKEMTLSERVSRMPKGCKKSMQAILDLELVISKDDVCERSKITRLVQYHKKHIAPKGLLSVSGQPVTSTFFQKYAIQVAYTCKKNLLQNFARAQEELTAMGKVFEEARERVYSQEPSIKSNMNLMEERLDDLSTANIKPTDKIEQGLNEYREALTKLTRPEDILTFDPDECRSSKNREIKISNDKVNVFFKPILMCHQLHRYFGGSILSIARLANYGYLAVDEELDAKLANDATVKNWIIATQVCDPMVYMKSIGSEDDWTFVDTCVDEVQAIEVLVFDDHIEELEPDKLREMLTRSESTRSYAQKLMKSAMRKMAKIDMLKQISEDTSKRSIFRKSLSVLANRRMSFDPVRLKAEPLAKLRSNLASPSKQEVDRVELQMGIFKQPPMPEAEAFKLLIKMVDDERETCRLQAQASTGRMDEPVGFEVMSHLASIATILAIMITFEWLFFIVMTLAARLCHHLYFNFQHLLTFPPKVLSWSDADFAKLTDRLEKLDEDDYFDFHELSPYEQQQRLLLAKVFGNPPPMLYKD